MAIFHQLRILMFLLVLGIALFCGWSLDAECVFSPPANLLPRMVKIFANCLLVFGSTSNSKERTCC